NPARAVEQNVGAELDMPRLRPQQTRDRVDDGRLAGARRPEQRRHAGLVAEFELRVEHKIAEPVKEANRAGHCPTNVRVRRPSQSANTRPASASPIDSAANLAAAASPPGV